jgi:cytochrome b561
MPDDRPSAGYHVVTKLLHWLTVVALVGQLLLGYTMEGLSESLTEADEGDADEALVFLHAWVGGAILVLGVLRLLWRKASTLPPWAPQLSERDRRLAHRTEQALYALLFLMPATGLALLFLSGEEREVTPERDWQPPFELVEDDLLLAAHIGSHVLLYIAVVVHVALAVRRRTVHRMV